MPLSLQSESSNIPTISVAMIAYNAETTIGVALESVRYIADQIIVIDSNSADATPQIASQYGAEVHYRQWTNNFADARNYALQLCRNPWVLVLDSDEALDEISLRKDFDLLLNPTIGGVSIEIKNILNTDGSVVQSHHYTRLFRNDNRIRFCGTIHEQIADSILGTGLQIRPSAIYLHHYGYAEHNPEKIQRNIQLLKQELYADNDNPWLMYHIGITEFTAGNLPQSEKYLRECLAVERHHSVSLSQEQREIATIRLAQIALANDDLRSVERLLHFSSSDIHREGLRLFVLAGSLCMQMRFSDALILYSMKATQQSSLVDSIQLNATLKRIAEILKIEKSSKRADYHKPQSDDLWLGMFT